MSTNPAKVGKKLNIELFQGDDSQDIFDWVREYNALAAAQGWNSEQKLRSLPAYLGQAPLEAFHSYFSGENTQEDPDVAWKAIISKFYKHYRPSNALFKYTADFLALKCGPQERVRAFSNRIDSAIYRLGQVDTSLAEACETFKPFKLVHGLPSRYHPQLSPKVQGTSFRKLRKRAIILEEGFATDPISKSKSATINAASGLPGSDSLLAAITNPKDNHQDSCSRCGRNNHPRVKCVARFHINGNRIGKRRNPDKSPSGDGNPDDTPSKKQAGDYASMVKEVTANLSKSLHKQLSKEITAAIKQQLPPKETEMDEEPKN